MKHRLPKSILTAVCLCLWTSTGYAGNEDETVCFESRKGSSEVIQREIRPGWPNVKCSPRTAGVLWWGDPFDGTIPMGDMPIEAEYSHAEAVVKPRDKQIDKNGLLTYLYYGMSRLVKYVPRADKPGSSSTEDASGHSA